MQNNLAYAMQNVETTACGVTHELKLHLFATEAALVSMHDRKISSRTKVARNKSEIYMPSLILRSKKIIRTSLIGFLIC